jgi:hypothetical protein
VAFEAELPTVLGNGVGAAVAAVGHGVDPALAGLRVVIGALAATPSAGRLTPPRLPSPSRTALRSTTRSRCWSTAARR